MKYFSNGTEMKPFLNIPVFWTAQYGKSIRYAGRTSKAVSEVVVSIKGESNTEDDSEVHKPMEFPFFC